MQEQPTASPPLPFSLQALEALNDGEHGNYTYALTFNPRTRKYVMLQVGELVHNLRPFTAGNTPDQAARDALVLYTTNA